MAKISLKKSQSYFNCLSIEQFSLSPLLLLLTLVVSLFVSLTCASASTFVSTSYTRKTIKNTETFSVIKSQKHSMNRNLFLFVHSSAPQSFSFQSLSPSLSSLSSLSSSGPLNPVSLSLFSQPLSSTKKELHVKKYGHMFTEEVKGKGKFNHLSRLIEKGKSFSSISLTRLYSDVRDSLKEKETERERNKKNKKTQEFNPKEERLMHTKYEKEGDNQTRQYSGKSGDGFGQNDKSKTNPNPNPDSDSTAKPRNKRQNLSQNQNKRKTATIQRESRGTNLLVVGLGNPGAKYENTRHNAGFMVMDELARRFSVSLKLQKSFDGEYGSTNLHGKSVGFLKPSTFMNLSGQSVRKVKDFYKLNTTAILVIVDDVNLDVGQIKLRQTGSAGGQNGLKNIEQQLKTKDYARIRIGIGRPQPGQMVDYVLSNFSNREKSQLEDGIYDTLQAIEEWIAEDDIGKVMHKVNSPK